MTVRLRPKSAETRCAPGRTRRMAAAVGLVLLWPAPAGAVALLELLGDPAAPQPFVARSLASGPAATYFNPALLFDVGESAVVGAHFLAEDLHIGLDARPAGVDVPGAVYQARVVTQGGSVRLADRPLPTADLRSQRGSFQPSDERFFLSLGGSFEPLEDRIAIGFYVLFPLREVQSQRPFFVDEREQYFSNSLHFELYEDRLAQTALAFAVAFRPIDAISFGGGLTIATVAETNARVFIPDATDQGVADVSAAVTVGTRLVPHFGLALAPLPQLRLTTTVHLAYGSDVEGESDIQLWNYPYADGEDAFIQPFESRYGAQPLRVGLGASWSSAPATDGSATPGWHVAAGALWSRWSGYRDRQQRRPSARWSDVWSASVAGGVTIGNHELGAGLRWVPSPVPRQDGRTNYVDNDRLGFGFGWRGRFPVGDTLALTASAQVQAHRLLPRSVRKSSDAADPVRDELPAAVDVRTDAPIAEAAGLQTNNPGYPGFTTEGWLTSVGVSVGLAF